MGPHPAPSQGLKRLAWAWATPVSNAAFLWGPRPGWTTAEKARQFSQSPPGSDTQTVEQSPQTQKAWVLPPLAPGLRTGCWPQTPTAVAALRVLTHWLPIPPPIHTQGLKCPLIPPNTVGLLRMDFHRIYGPRENITLIPSLNFNIRHINRSVFPHHYILIISIHLFQLKSHKAINRGWAPNTQY